MCRALARILKLPIIFEGALIQNGLKLYKWSKLVLFCQSKAEFTCLNDRHDRSLLRPWSQNWKLQNEKKQALTSLMNGLVAVQSIYDGRSVFVDFLQIVCTTNYILLSLHFIFACEHSILFSTYLVVYQEVEVFLGAIFRSTKTK